MIKKQLETEKDLNVTQEVRGLAARPASARLHESARQTPQEVFAAYETTPQGQPRPDIMRALFGRNELARKKADSILKRLFKAFINPFTVVLIVLAGISFITDYAIGEPEETEEERRLCYVALTRAREHLILTCARQRMLFGRTTANRVSRFVEEIPDEDIRKLNVPHG